MKKLIRFRCWVAFVLLLSMGAPLLSSYTVIHYQRKQVRKQVKRQLIAGLPAASLVKMTFSKKDTEEKLQWKHAREFAYNNEMYDIVSQTDLGDSIAYLLWWDSEETQLNKQLNELLVQQAKKMPPGKEQALMLDSFFKTLCFSPPFSFSHLAHFTFEKAAIFSCENYLSPLIEKLTPPPDWVGLVV